MTASEIRADQPATLLLKTTYHPGWQATLDGVPVETLMVMPNFAGLPIPFGSHRVTFTYQPAPGRTPLLLSSLLLLLLLAMLERWPSLWPLRLYLPLGVARWGEALAAAGKTYRLHLGLYLVLAGLYLAAGAGHFFSTDHVSVYPDHPKPGRRF